MFANVRLIWATGLALVMWPGAQALADPADVYGLWRTQAGTSIVEIADCGDETPCGSVRWLDPIEVSVDEDVNNPDPELAGRSLLGLRILSGFEKSRRGWSEGEIYDPEKGKSFAAKLRRLEDSRLEVKGCVAFFCQTQIWTIEETAAEELRE
ncbi:MAG: DUF2147 domain-containing protein [Pseudomonadaceae bacterium]|nr:DUF2147 domain-containing protein [Pseudomonadaceae bacterium]